MSTHDYTHWPLAQVFFPTSQRSNSKPNKIETGGKSRGLTRFTCVAAHRRTHKHIRRHKIRRHLPSQGIPLFKRAGGLVSSERQCFYVQLRKCRYDDELLFMCMYAHCFFCLLLCYNAQRKKLIYTLWHINKFMCT